MTDIRQSTLYAQFMTRIGWQVEKLDGVFVYIKKLPFLPPVIKIQRPNHLPPENKVRQLMKKYGAQCIYVEPAENSMLHVTCYMLHDEPFLQTKTIIIYLMADEQTIFNRFSDPKRRAVRRAQKNGLQVEITDNIDAFIKIKNETTGPLLGFLTTMGVTKPLWNTFAPKNARVLLVNSNTYLAGILLLWYGKTAYYWMAAATSEGKKLFAPTLLVWEALKFAKKQGCSRFDFEGVYDERYPLLGKNWLGFTKFKEGFGGKEIYYPKAMKFNY